MIERRGEQPPRFRTDRVFPRIPLMRISRTRREHRAGGVGPLRAMTGHRRGARIPTFTRSQQSRLAWERSRDCFGQDYLAGLERLETPTPDLKTGIYRLALQRKNRKNALMDAAERFSGDEPFQGFMTEYELSQGEVAFAA